MVSYEASERFYGEAKSRYAEIGVDTDSALERLAQIPISIHCWQGDDVGGFETPDAELSGGGILAVGNYPGKARSVGELRDDLDKALSLIPGTHRISLLSHYLENQGKAVDRNEMTPAHFQGWIDWARERNLGMDFFTSCFSHPKADDGFTLAHADDEVRRFWIEHCQATRRIAAEIGKQLGTPCVNNVWIPDGFKDMPVDRLGPRRRLKESLDTIFADPFDPVHLLDSVECKLFGIGSESYVVGSHEFYLAYAAANKKLLCLDTGHFHPTEVVSDKLSAVLLFVDEVLLHVSRGVRWDSDHVIILSDELLAIAQEIVRGDFLNRVHIGLDFFDASINRIAAWVVGTRSMMRALLLSLLEPTAMLREFEAGGDFTSRLALLEELKMLPAGAVWDYYCCLKNVPVGMAWMDDVKAYEREYLTSRK